MPAPTKDIWGPDSDPARRSLSGPNLQKLEDRAFELKQRFAIPTELEYGAAADGATDDQAKLLDSINTAVTNKYSWRSKPGVVYSINTPLVVANPCDLDWNGSTVKKSASFNGPAIRVTGNNVTQRRLKVDGNRSAGALGDGIEWQGGAGKLIESNVDHCASQGIVTTTNYLQALETIRCSVTDCGANGYLALTTAIRQLECFASLCDTGYASAQYSHPGCQIDMYATNLISNGAWLRSQGARVRRLVVDSAKAFGFLCDGAGYPYPAPSECDFEYIETRNIGWGGPSAGSPTTLVNNDSLIASKDSNTINVQSTAGFAASGYLVVSDPTTLEQLYFSYSGISGSNFTGCRGPYGRTLFLRGGNIVKQASGQNGAGSGVVLNGISNSHVGTVRAIRSLGYGFQYGAGCMDVDTDYVLCDARGALDGDPGINISGNIQKCSISKYVVRGHTWGVSFGETVHHNNDNIQFGEVLAFDLGYPVVRGVEGAFAKFGRIIGRDCWTTESTLGSGELGDGLVIFDSAAAHDNIVDRISHKATQYQETGTATSGAATTLTDSNKGWFTNIFTGWLIRITGGTGSGQSRRVSSNTNNAITVDSAWGTNPDATSVYQLIEDGGIATGGGSNTLTDTNKNFQFGRIGHVLKIVAGTGAGQQRRVLSHTATVITVDTNWTTIPDNTSAYQFLRMPIKLVSCGAAATNNKVLEGDIATGDCYGAAATDLNGSNKICLHPHDSIAILTYGTTVTPEAAVAEYQTLNVTNGTAFTIANPTCPCSGKFLTIDIKNSSGGAMGAITWGAAFLLAGAFTNPLNGKRRTISFRHDGTNWVETNRAAADI